MRLYYDTIPDLGWKLMIQIQRDELVEPIASMTTVLIIVCIIALIATTVIVIWQVNGISKSVKSVQQFSDGLAAGDLTIDQLKVKSKDELGKMGSPECHVRQQSRDDRKYRRPLREDVPVLH